MSAIRLTAALLRSDGYDRSNLEASNPDLRHEARPDQSERHVPETNSERQFHLRTVIQVAIIQ